MEESFLCTHILLLAYPFATKITKFDHIQRDGFSEQLFNTTLENYILVRKLKHVNHSLHVVTDAARIRSPVYIHRAGE